MSEDANSGCFIILGPIFLRDQLPNFVHTYHRNLDNKTLEEDQPVEVYCQPPIRFVQNHHECLFRHFPFTRLWTTISSENNYVCPPTNFDGVSRWRTFSIPFKRKLPNGLTFRANMGMTWDMMGELETNHLSPLNEMYERFTSEEVYDGFMTGWNKSLWELDEVFGNGLPKDETLSDAALYGAAKLYICRLANTFLSFQPNFTAATWAKIGDGSGKRWRDAPLSDDRSCPDLILEGLAVISTKIGNRLGRSQMLQSLNRALSAKKVFFVMGGRRMNAKEDEDIQDAWLEAFYLFQLHRVRYVLMFNGGGSLLFYLKKKDEVEISTYINPLSGQTQPKYNIVLILVSLAVLAQPVSPSESEELFIPLRLPEVVGSRNKRKQKLDTDPPIQPLHPEPAPDISQDTPHPTNPSSYDEPLADSVSATFIHTYHRDLTENDTPETAKHFCKPSIDFPRNHHECLSRCSFPVPLLSRPEATRPADTTSLFPVQSQFSSAFFKEYLPNGLTVTFATNAEVARDLIHKLESRHLSKPKQAFEQSGLDRFGQKRYDVFMARWNKAIWEWDGVFRSWPVEEALCDAALFAIAKFYACRLANLFLSFEPNFTPASWEKISMDEGWREALPSKSMKGQSCPDLVIEGRAVLTPWIGKKLDFNCMVDGMTSTRKVHFDAEGIRFEDSVESQDVAEAWLEIIRLFHSHQVRYVLVFNDTGYQLYHLRTRNEVEMSFYSQHPHGSISTKSSFNLVSLLVALALAPQPSSKNNDEGLFVPLHLSDTKHGRLPSNTKPCSLMAEFPRYRFSLDLSKFKLRLSCPPLQASDSSPSDNTNSSNSDSPHRATQPAVLNFIDNCEARNPPMREGITIVPGKSIGYGRLWTAWEGMMFGYDDFTWEGFGCRKDGEDGSNVSASFGTSHSNPLSVVFKLAFPVRQRSHPDYASTLEDAEEAILNEAEIYTRSLQQLQGVTVPRFYGLFKKGGVWCMVLENVGGEIPDHNLEFGGVSHEHREAVLDAYAALCRQRVIHGDIELRHLCVDPLASRASLRLIDFDEAREGTQEELHEEWKCIWGMLTG